MAATPVAAIEYVPFVMMPDAPAFTRTVTVNDPAEPAANVPIVHVMVPVPPTAGLVQSHPSGALTDSNVVFSGVPKVSRTFAAS